MLVFGNYQLLILFVDTTANMQYLTLHPDPGHSTGCGQIEDDILLLVSLPLHQALPRSNFIPPESVSVADSEAAHNDGNGKGDDEHATEGAKATGEFAQEGIRLQMIAHCGQGGKAPPNTVIERPKKSNNSILH